MAADDRMTGGTVDGADAEDEMPAEGVDLWSRVRIEPIEIALGRDSGYTLRAYRPEDDLTRSKAEPDEESADLDVDGDGDRRGAGHRYGGDGSHAGSEVDDRTAFDDDIAADDEDGADDDEDDEVGADDEIDGTDEPAGDEGSEVDEGDEVEEAPVFLGAGGRLYLFRTPEGLVEFVRSGAESDLSQLDTWSELVSGIEPAYVVPDPADRYELDLVVENLRGGHDVWDPPLLIKAGEIARDLGYALRIEPVIAALAPGSPLDDLDEGLRAVESGGLGSLFARRRLRKLKEQQASLAWRTVIGKISGLVDWRD